MYKCQCGNISNFKEIYSYELIIKQKNNGKISKLKKNLNIIEIICLSCNDTTEDGVIFDNDGEQIFL